MDLLPMGEVELGLQEIVEHVVAEAAASSVAGETGAPAGEGGEP